EGEPAALYLLVLGDQIHQFVNARHAAGNLTHMGRQSDRRKMSCRTIGLGRGDQALARGKLESQDHPERHRLAVQQTVGKPSPRLKRVAEGVAEVEQSALAA